MAAPTLTESNNPNSTWPILTISVERRTHTAPPPRGHWRRAVVILVALVTAAVGVMVLTARRADAITTAQWCQGEVQRAAQLVEPVRSRLGGQITLLTPANATERAEVDARYTLDSTGLTVASRREGEAFQIVVIVDCTEIKSRRQRTALRFLAMHEFAHALQYVSQPNPSFQSPEAHEHEADCAANVLMRVVYNTRLRMSYGAHGGCPAHRFDATWTWLISAGVR